MMLVRHGIQPLFHSSGGWSLYSRLVDPVLTGKLARYQYCKNKMETVAVPKDAVQGEPAVLNLWWIIDGADAQMPNYTVSRTFTVIN